MTNYHKRNVFKQYKFIILKCWRSEVRNQSQSAKINVLAGGILLGNCEGESVSLPFQVHTGCLHLLASDLILYPQSQLLSIFHSLSLSLTLLPPSFPYKKLCEVMSNSLQPHEL